MNVSLLNPIMFSKNCCPIRDKQSQTAVTIPNKSFGNEGLSLTSNYNKAFINKTAVSFKGYYGNQQPAKKLFWILSGTSDVYENQYTNSHLYRGGNTGWKKWVQLPPEELLKFNPKDSIEAICSLTKQPNCYPGIPSYIPTPNYGDRWGRRANYIEINPRTIACTRGGEKTEGLLSLIKLLPAIPPSPTSFANCIILSQLYPAFERDGETGDSSLYTANLYSGISKNLTSKGLCRGDQKMGDDELVKSFNDLAHMRGLKTGIRMPLSSGQLKVQGGNFDWYHNQDDFINACCDAVDLGFDAIYFDSAKHVGNYDMSNYHGNGSVPNFQQMQYITEQIKVRTKRCDISLIGEKCDKDYRNKEMGLSAGTDWSRPDNFDSVLYEYDQQRYNDDYATGPDISNDNDYGGMSYEQRLNRVKNSLNGFRDPGFKLPSFMQMQDLFPMNNYTNTHKQMMESQNHSPYSDDTYSHFNNLFNPDGRWLTDAVYNEFANVMYR